MALPTSKTKDCQCSLLVICFSSWQKKSLKINFNQTKSSAFKTDRKKPLPLSLQLLKLVVKKQSSPPQKKAINAKAKTLRWKTNLRLNQNREQTRCEPTRTPTLAMPNKGYDA